VRDLSHPDIERYRIKTPQILQRYGSFGDHTSGVFLITAKTDGKKVKLQVIASSGMGWDHLSISLPNRTPVWSEMEKVKRIFFKEDEWGIQYHAPQDDHINFHSFCLHIWRPHHDMLPKPPKFMV